jgi:nucleoside-diphosphate-sugar epimerase
MKLAVTGANGFVGKALCKRLLADGHQVTAITRQPWSQSGIQNYVISDYASPALQEALQGQDCIFHLAAKTHSGTKATQTNLNAYRKINVELSSQLAKVARDAGVTRFIYLSSIKVNGEQTFEKPFSNIDPPAPEDAYGISKMEAEAALRVICKDTMELVIVRPPLIWSRNELKGNLALLKKLMDWGIPLPLRGLNNSRDLISLDNLCDFLALCAHKPAIAGQVFLVSDGKPYTSLDIAKLVGSPKSIPLPQKVYDLLARAKRARKLFGNLELDIGHTSQTTGWTPTKNY